MRLPRLALLTGLLAAGTAAPVAGAANGCSGARTSELPRDESRIEVGRPEPAPAASAPARPAERPTTSPTTPAGGAPASGPARPALPPLAESAFTPLVLDGARGGSLAYDLEGGVEAVGAMLLDYDHADGQRAWAETYRTVGRDGDRERAEWKFRGKLGVAPRVVLDLERERVEGDAIRVRFQLSETAFGLKRFFGDWRVEPVAGVPDRAHVTARVFIDSGLPFVNASHDDVRDGLREDARLMRAWMDRRLASARSTGAEAPGRPGGGR